MFFYFKIGITFPLLLYCFYFPSTIFLSHDRSLLVAVQFFPFPLRSLALVIILVLTPPSNFYTASSFLPSFQTFPGLTTSPSPSLLSSLSSLSFLPSPSCPPLYLPFLPLTSVFAKSHASRIICSRIDDGLLTKQKLMSVCLSGYI